MSEYNADIRHDECCGQSIHAEEPDDLFDDINNPDDSEVFFQIKKLIIFFFSSI